MLPLTESARITLATREKLETKHGARHAIQCSRKHDIAINKRRRCYHRIILLVIRTAGGVAVIICRWHVKSAAARSQCNAEAGVVVNGVAENGPSGVIASEASDADAVQSVKGDDIAFPCIHASDRPDGRIASGDAAVSVAQRCAVNVGADFVALDHYAYRSAANKNPVGTRIDYIGCTLRAATDGSVE